MRQGSLVFLVGALGACSSIEDYAYPAPYVETAPAAIEVGDGAVLAYDGAFAPLPVVAASIQGRPVRALIATRRNQSSIAPEAVPGEAVVAGEATFPVQTAEGVAPLVRDVVRVPELELGDVRVAGLLLLVEPLPPGIDVALVPAAFPGAVLTLDGPERELRLRQGRLPEPADDDNQTVRLQSTFLFGSCVAKSTRFMASIMVVAASELDGSVMTGPEKSSVVETRRGPERLPAGPGALTPLITGEREVRMDGVFGRDYDRVLAQVVEPLGSGWLVLGARHLASMVLELDPANRLARLR